jgi:hypothetical protein
MKTLELRLSPGATDTLVREKPALKRARLKSFSCPCGCGRNRSFTQPRSLRTSGFVTVTPGSSSGSSA